MSAEADLARVIHRLAKRLDQIAPWGWWHMPTHPATMVVALAREDGRPLDAEERRACAVDPLDAAQADAMVRAWGAERDRRRTAGTPLVAVGEAAPVRDGHVRLQTDDAIVEIASGVVQDEGTAALWFHCDHCGTTRHSRAATRGQLRRDAHDFLLRHKHCSKPKEMVQ